MRAGPRPLQSRGFTLMEVMIAIALLAMVTAISWRGLDGMLRTQATLTHNNQSLAVAQTSLAQWNTDLNAMMDVPYLTALDWDGKVFRMTRAAPRALASEPAALQVVAWSDRSINGVRYWARWHSGPVTTRQEWQAAWQSAQQWAREARNSATAREVLLLPMVQWEIFYSREGHWVNPQSSAQTQTNTTDPNADNTAEADSLRNARNFALPDSVRLRIELAPGGITSGWLGTDWLNPQQGGARL